MQNSFTKGLIIGGIIGASIGMIVEPDTINTKNRKKMLRSGKDILSKTGNVIGDVIELFR
jgi:gas vesicle protein